MQFCFFSALIGTPLYVNAEMSQHQHELSEQTMRLHKTHSGIYLVSELPDRLAMGSHTLPISLKYAQAKDGEEIRITAKSSSGLSLHENVFNANFEQGVASIDIPLSLVEDKEVQLSIVSTLPQSDGKTEAFTVLFNQKDDSYGHLKAGSLNVAKPPGRKVMKAVEKK